MHSLFKVIAFTFLVSHINGLVRQKRFIWDDISGGFKDVGNAFDDAGSVIGKSVNDLGGDIIDTAQDTGDALNNAGSVIQNGVNDFGGGIVKTAGTVGDAFEEGAKQTGGAFEDLGGYIKEGAEQTGGAFEDLGGYIKEGAKQTGGAFEDGIGVIKDGFDDLSDEVKTVVKEVIDALKDPAEDVKDFFEKEVYEEAKKAVEKLSDVDFDKLLAVVLDVLSQLDKLASYRVCTGVCKYSMGLVIPQVGGTVVCPLVCDVILHSVYGLLESDVNDPAVSDNVFVDECQVQKTCNECNKACDVSLVMNGPLYNVTFRKYSQAKAQQQEQADTPERVNDDVKISSNHLQADMFNLDGRQPQDLQSLQKESNDAMHYHLPQLTLLCCAVALTIG